MFKRSILPDVTSHNAPQIQRTLQWVGMEKIAIPLCVAIGRDEVQQVSASTSLYVSLDRAEAKGIHMSRLHLLLNERLAGKQLTIDSISSLLKSLVQSQEGISQSAKLSLEFELVLQKPALLSGESAFQAYRFTIDAEYVDQKIQVSLDLTVPYSSTCPCSASLSRQLYADAIDQKFSDDAIDKRALLDWVVSEAGSIATPHSQRSYAYVGLSLAEHYWPDLGALVFEMEQAIGTPVQTAVKRQDEQAFARLNAENLMFCEDAARKLKTKLESMPNIIDYTLKMEHQESLHAHNAVVIDRKISA